MKNQDIKKRKLKVWESDRYYKTARRVSLDRDHFGIKLLKKLSRNANSILDIGCGEGTKLAFIAEDKRGVGIDISKRAISLAKKNYPKFNFKNGDLMKLPFKDDQFDLVYSAFVLEHINNVEKAVQEAVRVTKKGGKLVFVAPNFGAPNRASPNFEGSRMIKMIKGFLYDLFGFFKEEKHMNWNKVVPQDSPKTYIPDSDTTIEPYIKSLVSYLRTNNMKVITARSCWAEELPQAKIHQKIFKYLAGFNIYPFRFWGPHLVVYAVK